MAIFNNSPSTNTPSPFKAVFTGDYKNIFKNASQRKEISGFPTTTNNQDQFQASPSINTNNNIFNSQDSSINSASDQALDDFYAIAEGKSQDVLNKRIYNFLNGSFDDSSMSPVKGAFDETYAGVPEGNMLTDVNVKPDIEFKKQLLESKIQYLLSYLMSLLEQGPQAIAALLRKRGLSEEKANTEAFRLFNEIQRKAPEFVASAQQAVKYARARMEGMDQISQANEKNSGALKKKVDDVIGKWGGGGG